MNEGCLFCEIANGADARVVWEDSEHLAFLTPFPNTEGFTVLIPRRHHPSYIMQMEPAAMLALFAAAREVALLLDRALGTRRTGIIAEGMGIDHAHLKLAPMHGIPEGEWRPIRSRVRSVYAEYPGYIASHDGPAARPERLDEVAARIRNYARAASAPQRGVSR